MDEALNKVADGQCPLHKSNRKRFFYSSIMDGWACGSCIEEGMFSSVITAEFLDLYADKICLKEGNLSEISRVSGGILQDKT